MTVEQTQQLLVATRLLQNTLPHLDLMVSEHNDGVRLRRDILMFLAGLGFPGELAVREAA